MTSPFAELADAIVDEWLARHPTEATYYGDHSYDDRLEDPSADAAQQRAVEVRGHLGTMSRIHTTTAIEQLDGTIGLIEQLVPSLAAGAGRDTPDTTTAVAALAEATAFVRTSW